MESENLRAVTHPAIRRDQRIRVLIVNDQLSVSWFLEQLVDRAGGRMTVVGNATNAGEALKRVAELAPDVILFDLDLYNEDATAALPQLIASSSARVLVMTGQRDRAIGERAVLAGACGVLGKDQPPENILRAIEKVHERELWLERPSTGRIFMRLAKRAGGLEETEERRGERWLTPRERDIVRIIAAEPTLSLKVIAERQHISRSTLKNHLTSIYEKLGVANRMQLHVYATSKRLPESRKSGVGTPASRAQSRNDPCQASARGGDPAPRVPRI